MLGDWTISADAFNEDFSTWTNVFEAVAEEKDTELMRRLLSDASERLLNVVEERSREELHIPTKLKQNPGTHLKGDGILAQICRLQRVVKQSRRCPSDSSARRRVHTKVIELLDTYPDL